MTIVSTSILGSSFSAATFCLLVSEPPKIRLTLVPVAASKGPVQCFWNALPKAPPQVAMVISSADADAPAMPSAAAAAKVVPISLIFIAFPP